MDEAVEAYRALLEAAVEDLGAARSPAEFCEAERRVVSLTQQMAGALTQGALQQACDDPERVSEAVARIRERASRRGLQLRHERDRPTSVRTLSGEVVKVVTPYYTARPRSDRPLKKRGAQGTGVYPVLDQLGIAGRQRFDCWWLGRCARPTRWPRPVTCCRRAGWRWGTRPRFG